MAAANQFILAIGLLLFASILASRISDRVGAPLLLVFLLIGMLVGAEGPGGVVYEDVFSANLLANLALAIILFDGGLRTPLSSFRVGLRPAVVLATVGVVITSAITGYAAHLIFDMSLLEGMLLGAIVGSTDAAAVFALLHSHGLQLNDRVRSTLEIESGSNDPMAVFLTLSLIELVQRGGGASGLMLLQDFIQQLGLGAVVAFAVARLLIYMIDRVNLAGSLYPLLALSGGLCLYGLAATLGGSGFLAAYLGGLMLGNRVRQARNDIRRFHDGMAWLCQISLFVLLGLLVTPSELVPIIPQALLTALVLIFIARPAAVLLCLVPFRFSWPERFYISWVGLRGAVPIVLGLYPLVAGVTDGRFSFNVAFFVVLVSLVVQGWTVAPAARLLGLRMPTLNLGQQLAEIDAPGLHNHELTVYRIPPRSPALGMTLKQLDLPRESQVVALVRHGESLPNPYQAPLAPNDNLYILAASRVFPAVEDALGGVSTSPEERQYFGPFVLSGDTRIADIVDAYDIHDLKPELHGKTVADLFRSLYGRSVAVGDRAELGDLEFVIRRLQRDRILQVGLKPRARPLKKAHKAQ